MPCWRTFPCRAPAREAERVAPGQHVAQPGQHAQAPPVGRPELDLEQADRLDHLAVERLVDAAGAEGEHDRRAVGGRELVVRELNVADERRRARPRGARSPTGRGRTAPPRP